MSNPGYLPDWHVDIQAMFTKRDIFFFFFSDEQWAWGEEEAYKLSA